MAQFDFTNKNPPMQGVSLADLIAARQSPLTTVLQGAAPIIQALNQKRQQQQQLASLQALQSGQQLTPENIMNLPQQATDYAKLQDIQAQAIQRLTPKTPASGQMLTPKQTAALQFGIENQILAPSEISFRGPRTQVLADGISTRDDFQKWYEQFQKTGASPNPNAFNPRGADVGLAAQRSGAEAKSRIQQGKGQEIGALAGTVEDTLNAAEPLVAKLSPTAIRKVNEAYRLGLTQVDNQDGSIADPQNVQDANALLTYLADATAAEATVLHGGGSPTDSDMKLATSYLSRGIGPQGFAGVKSALSLVNRSRVKRTRGAGFDEPGVTPQNVDGNTMAAGTVMVQTSDGQTVPILRKNLAIAKQRDPGLKILGQ